MTTIAEHTIALNEGAKNHTIGGLQELRRELKGLSRLPTHQLFNSSTTKDNYAFHVGGRTELQFNIGNEQVDGEDCLRYGVAFSLELSQALPDIAVLLPLVAKFNEFLRQYPDEFTDLHMWHDPGCPVNARICPRLIPPEIVEPGTFIFLGGLQLAENVDYEGILDTFDRLWPLYRFVQGSEKYPVLTEARKAFSFVPGCSSKPISTKASKAQKELDISLRHNELQFELHQYLSGKYGADAVGAERGNGAGDRIDVMVRLKSGYRLYEIKTALSARGCIREALAQLLVYSFWPGAQEAERLIIVGEPPLDNDSKKFMELLRNRYSLPIYYAQFNSASGKLVGDQA